MLGARTATVSASQRRPLRRRKRASAFPLVTKGRRYDTSTRLGAAATSRAGARTGLR